MKIPRLFRRRPRGGYTTKSPAHHLPAGTVHKAEYYLTDKTTAEHWKAAHPEAHVYYDDGPSWVEITNQEPRHGD